MEEQEKALQKAKEALKDKDYDQAVIRFKEITDKYPDYAPAHAELASILLRTDTPQNAVPYLNKALHLEPSNIRYQILAAQYHKRQQAYPQALEIIQKIIKGTNDKDALYEAVQIYTLLGEKEMALAIAKKLMVIEPDNVTYIWEYGRALQALGKKREALVYYNNLVHRTSKTIPDNVFTEWFNLMSELRYLKELKSDLENIIEIYPKSIYLRLMYVRSCKLLLDIISAQKMLDKIYKMEPENSSILRALAVSYSQFGDFEKAKYYYLESLKSNPLNTDAIRGLSLLNNVSENELYDFTQFALAHLGELSVDERVHLHYAAGNLFDKRDELKLAFEHYKLGGMLHSKGQENKEIEEVRRSQAVIKTKIDAQLLKKYALEGCKEKGALFVVGMPRSGTTLTEQILTCLDGLYGAGELSFGVDVLDSMKVGNIDMSLHGTRKFFNDQPNSTFRERGAKYLELCREIAPDNTRYVIDKMPDNFKFVGFLHMILPEAKFIHMRRHPVETCLSAYRLLFLDGHFWSDDLKRLGQYYRLYHNLMQYWMEIMPRGKIIELKYENLINDVEGESKRLSQFLDVEWNSQCLHFHKNKREVLTASSVQVRQPIYTSSTGRWKRYEPYLKPLLDEISDIVESYENELNPIKENQ